MIQYVHLLLRRTFFRFHSIRHKSTQINEELAMFFSVLSWLVFIGMWAVHIGYHGSIGEPFSTVVEVCLRGDNAVPISKFSKLATRSSTVYCTLHQKYRYLMKIGI